MLTREFNLNSLLIVWDYIFSGIEEDYRFMLLQQKDSHESIYQDNNYFLSHSDCLINLDYICLAMIQYQRAILADGDFIDCFKTMMGYPKIEGAMNIINLSNRIKKILFGY